MINNQFSWEVDDFQSLKPQFHRTSLMSLHMTVDDIIVSLILIHQIRKGSLDTRTLLVYRIIKRIHQTVHSLGNLIHIYSIPYLLVKQKQFFPIIYQILEFNTFRMVQEEQIECLVDRTELYLFITKLRQQETIIRRYDQRTEGSPCCLNAKLLLYGHTDSFQQKVSSSFCQKLGGKRLYNSSFLLCTHISQFILHTGCKNTKRIGKNVSLHRKIFFRKPCVSFIIV